MQKVTDLRKFDAKQLKEELEKAQNKLYKIRLTVKGEKKTSPSELKKFKKYIAQIKTIQKEITLKNNQ